MVFTQSKYSYCEEVAHEHQNLSLSIVWLVAYWIGYFVCYLTRLVTIDRILSIIVLHINNIIFVNFENGKNVCINMPGDFVSVVLNNESNDFLGPTAVPMSLYAFIVLSSQ